MGFRKGKGTRDAVFQLRMISERVQKLNTEVEKKGKIITKARKLYLCFVDYQKAFDRVKHDKLLEVIYVFISHKMQKKKHTQIQCKTQSIKRITYNVKNIRLVHSID